MPRTLIGFGESGTYKTHNLGLAYKYLYEKTGKPGIHWCWDASGWAPIQPLVNVGIVRPIMCVGLRFPWTAVRKMGMGLVPGTAVWEKPTPDEYGWAGVDTISGIGDTLMENLRSEGRQIAQDVVGKWVEGVGDTQETFCNNPMSHYGVVQREVLSLFRHMAALPLEYVLYMTHEAMGETEDTRSPIRGPALCGKAATPKVPKEVGACLHFEAYSRVPQAKEGEAVQVAESKVRAFFQSHPDPKVPNVMYNCKPRVPASQIPALLARFPGGFFVPTLTSGLDEFLRAEDELIEAASGSEAEWKRAVDLQRKRNEILAK
jgi:hypothetical protein